MSGSKPPRRPGPPGAAHGKPGSPAKTERAAPGHGARRRRRKKGARPPASPAERTSAAAPRAGRDPIDPNRPSRLAGETPSASARRDPNEPVTERRRERPRTEPPPPPRVDDVPPVVPPESMRSEPSVPRSEIPERPRTGSAAPRSSPEQSHLRSLEDRLTRLTGPDEADAEPPPSIREQVSSAAREVVDRIAAPVTRVDESNVVDAVRDLLSSDYYLRQWGRLGMRNRSEEVDDFGLDPVYERRVQPIADFLYERYFRVDTQGVENIPPLGRCLVVANHSGTLPLDGLMLRTAVRREHPVSRDLRWLAEDYVWHLPFVGAFMTRVGGVRACQENAERLLSKESLVAVFPEGVKGIGKLFRDRYKLQRFGRGGFVRLALRTRTPLVPCAVVGAEEASPMLHRDELVSKVLGLPYLPVTPTFPLLGPLGLVPAPTKWKIRFGPAITFDDVDPGGVDDPVLVGRLAERVRGSIQTLLDASLGERKSVWFG